VILTVHGTWFGYHSKYDQMDRECSMYGRGYTQGFSGET
jgi:hypothetical protein